MKLICSGVRQGDWGERGPWAFIIHGNKPQTFFSREVYLFAEPGPGLGSCPWPKREPKQIASLRRSSVPFVSYRPPLGAPFRDGNSSALLPQLRGTIHPARLTAVPSPLPPRRRLRGRGAKLPAWSGEGKGEKKKKKEGGKS